MWTVLMQTFLMQTVLVHTVLMQTVLMCTYWQGKQIKKKQQQSTSNCKCNANAMPPGQQEGLCERNFYMHQQKQIKNKQQQSTYNAGPKQLQTFLMCTYWQGKQLKKKQQQSTSNCQCNTNAMPPRQKQRILWENLFDAQRQGGQIKNKQQWCRANTMLMQCHPGRYICKRIF